MSIKINDRRKLTGKSKKYKRSVLFGSGNGSKYITILKLIRYDLIATKM
jgi:hypothetical protein